MLLKAIRAITAFHARSNASVSACGANFHRRPGKCRQHRHALRLAFVSRVSQNFFYRTCALDVRLPVFIFGLVGCRPELYLPPLRHSALLALFLWRPWHADVKFVAVKAAPLIEDLRLCPKGIEMFDFVKQHALLVFSFRHAN